MTTLARCSDRMYTKPTLLTEPSDCRDFAKHLHQFGNDWRVDAGYVPGTVSPRTPCEVCDDERCIGQVHVSYFPRDWCGRSSTDVGVGCVEEFLSAVVLDEAGDPDVHGDLIDVEVRAVG